MTRRRHCFRCNRMQARGPAIRAGGHPDRPLRAASLLRMTLERLRLPAGPGCPAGSGTVIQRPASGGPGRQALAGFVSAA